MKRTMAILLTIVMVFALCACGNAAEPTAAPAAPAAPADNSAAAPAPVEDTTVYDFTFAHCEADDASTHDIVADAIVEYLNENAPGRFKCTVYPGAQLGADRENIESVQSGAITMTGQSTPVQVSFVPSLCIFDAPFAYRTLDDCEALLADENLMSLLDGEFEKAGIKQGLWVVGGYRHMTTNKEIKDIGDISGLKIRTMENKYHMKLFECLGATATPINSSELFTALQQGTVDGQENDYGVIVMKDIHSVQNYLTETHHLVAFNSYICNLDWYNNLPADLQKVFDEALAYAKEKGDAYTYENQDHYRQVISDAGVAMSAFTAEQIATMKEMCAPVYEMIANAEGMNMDVYNAFNAALDSIYAK